MEHSNGVTCLLMLQDSGTAEEICLKVSNCETVTSLNRNITFNIQ